MEASAVHFSTRERVCEAQDAYHLLKSRFNFFFFSLSEFEHFLKETIFKTTALKGDASFRTSNGPENKTLAEVLSSFLWRSFGEAGRGREGEVGRDGRGG